MWNLSLWRKGNKIIAIPLKQRYAIALRCLATNGDYRTIAHLLGVSSLIVRDVCDAIVHVLLPKYIQTPHGEHLQNIVDGFASKWGFPQCVGAIDGSHTPLCHTWTARLTNPNRYIIGKGSIQSFHKL